MGFNSAFKGLSKHCGIRNILKEINVSRRTCLKLIAVMVMMMMIMIMIMMMMIIIIIIIVTVT
jgi:hypothetical protein